MLEIFVSANRSEIIDRCRAKVMARSTPPPTPSELDSGIPMFLDQMMAELRRGMGDDGPADPQLSDTAAVHGYDMLMQGFSPSQVVHDYGDVCQAITELALEQEMPISADDFRMLNQCLDAAIAAAMTEYTRHVGEYQFDRSQSREERTDQGNRIKALGDGVRAALVAARGALLAITQGRVGFSGSTGRVLERTLQTAEELNDQLQLEILALEDRGSAGGTAVL